MELKQILKAVKALLSSLKMSQQPLENGSLIQYDGDTITTGEVVYLTTGEGNWSVLPDGEYKTKKGDDFTITNGTVSAVTVAPAAEAADDKKPVKQAQAKAEDKDKKPAYGDVEYADPGLQKDKKARYPIDTAEHIRAAWNYIHKAKNEAEYSADDLKKVKGAIETAWKKKIDPDGPPAEAKAEDMAEDGTMIEQAEEKKPKEVKAAADSVGTGGDVDSAGSPSENFDDETATPAVATVDVGDLIDAKLQPLFQLIYDLQAQYGSLRDMCSIQQTSMSEHDTRMSKMSALLTKVAEAPAGKPIEEEINSPVVADKNAKNIPGFNVLRG